MFQNKKKLVSLLVFATVAVAAFAIVLSTNANQNKDNADSRSEAQSSSKVSVSNDSKFDGYTNQDSSNGWWLNDTTYKAGNLRFDFEDSEVVTGTDNSKILVMHAKMSNISQKNIDAVKIYSGTVWAKQKSNNQEVNLQNVDDKLPKDSPAFQEAKNFRKQLLPGNSTEVVLNFELVNDSPITVHFAGATDGLELGQKTLTIKK